MKIEKICHYSNKGLHYNLLPAILVTPMETSFIIAFKWLVFHLGFKIKIDKPNKM